MELTFIGYDVNSHFEILKILFMQSKVKLSKNLRHFFLLFIELKE